MEPVEPRKRGHKPLGGASSHMRRRPGLREFINKLPQIMTFIDGARTVPMPVYTRYYLDSLLTKRPYLFSGGLGLPKHFLGQPN